MHNLHLVTNNPTSPVIDYTTALQLMQLQMLCQPGLLNSFLSQMAIMGQAMNSSNSNKVKTSVETSTDSCVVPIRERKRLASRCSDDLSSKRSKVIRRLVDDSETCSPVSGMFIKEASSLPPPDELQAAADLDETAVFVNVSEESRRKIEQITNIIGDCICALCKVRYDDVFRLAQHRCPRIIHEEYRCPECDKVFSCPANLASHRRWHKPRGNDPVAAASSQSSLSASINTFMCATCSVTFDTKKAFKLHSAHCSTILSNNSSHSQNHFLNLLQHNTSSNLKSKTEQRKICI
ncbi:LD18634p, putative [Brugia malayi]|uniref:BMA-EGL-46 n=1 Tax=Brugia malayi TaxID=6279 RepID=A0A0K0JH56_BRUMA|nr:LD18634p, putative [Brugia malayi]CRZ21925.1 BMA-EGL-46 [Brugia malayi]VIO97742.1 LD18634p, putative [Brugia malayi]